VFATPAAIAVISNSGSRFANPEFSEVMNMARIRMFQVDAFAGRPFAGNPAAVCLLEGEKDAAWMQAVAAEMNLSETAFVRRLDSAFTASHFGPTKARLPATIISGSLGIFECILDRENQGFLRGTMERSVRN
jgi:Phenazine biosynthesis-like protein